MRHEGSYAQFTHFNRFLYVILHSLKYKLWLMRRHSTGFLYILPTLSPAYLESLQKYENYIVNNTNLNGTYSSETERLLQIRMSQVLNQRMKFHKMMVNFACLDEKKCLVLFVLALEQFVT